METCYRHPDRETAVSCSNCGRPICPDCMTSTPVGMRCPECARQRTQVKRVNFGGLSAGSAAPATYVLIAINVIAFLAEIVSGGSLLDGGGTVYEKGALYAPAIANGDVWRIVTSGFLHAGLFHIAVNMYVLYVLGRVLEPGIGTVRFVGLYAASLLGGAFGALVAEPGAFTVGASGAVFGVMAATYLVAKQRGMEALAQQVGFFVLLNLFLSFSVNGISIGGHIGGLITGGIAAFAFTAAERRGGRNAFAIELGILVALAVIGFVGALVVANGYSPQPPRLIGG
jgi:membrane associated rhomboid family serine protease